MLEPIRLAEAFRAIDQPWQPRVVGCVNDFHVKVVKLEGEFLWHHHETEDELFLVVDGMLEMHLREGGEERVVEVEAGAFVIVPRGIEHKPVSPGGASVVLFEPATTLNTGTVVNERTWVDPASDRID